MRTNQTNSLDPNEVYQSDLSVETQEECSTVCYHPDCACRERTIAGCSLPIAMIGITVKKDGVREKSDDK